MKPMEDESSEPLGIAWVSDDGEILAVIVKTLSARNDKIIKTR